MVGRSEGPISRQALAHLAWRRDNDERNLIFGWLELLPAAMPELRGHPYVAHQVKGAKRTYVYVARFPMAADAAERWYQDATAGLVKLPAHPDRATSGDGSLLLAPPTVVEPQGGGESMAMDLPFLPASHGAAYVRGLFPEMPEGLGWELEDETAEWLADQLFFDLREPEHKLYLGALLHVRYGSGLRDVERHLAPRPDGGDDEIVRVVTWPGADMTGAEVIAVERQALGWSDPIRVPVTGPVVRISWPKRVGHTGLIVVHPSDGLCWWSDVAPFVRTIMLNVQLGGRRRQVVVEGKTRETYEVTELSSLRPDKPVLIGEVPDPSSVAARHNSAQAARERRRISASLGVRWFDDPRVAADDIRALLGRARQQVWIVDPYFAGVEVVRFALAVPARGVPVTIITSAEHLRSRANGTELGDSLEAVLNTVKEHVTVEGKVMLGGTAPLHDRFLVIDGRVWFSGNSLNAIGERASVLIEIPDADEILRHLNPILAAAVPFERWIAERRANREMPRPNCFGRILRALGLRKR